MTEMYKNVFMGEGVVSAEEAKLSVGSAAVLYGLSVYTVFIVSIDDDGNMYAFRLRDHFQRLLDSCKIIGIDTFEKTWTYDKFEKSVKELLQANEIKRNVFVRASVHVDAQIPRTRSRGLHTTLSIFIYDAEPILSPEGCRLKTSVWRRVPDFSIPSRAKVNGAYVNSVLAKQDALDSGYDDCLFLDMQGHVCELSAANIFMIRGEKVITPSVSSDLLEGINRRTVIELVQTELGTKVEERTVDLTELYTAEEVFATGTSAYIAPIIEVDKRKIGNGKVGSRTRQIQQLHADVRKGVLDRYKNFVTKIV